MADIIGRGTTPTNTFTVPIDLTGAVEMKIYYAQLGRVIFEKTLPDITVSSTKLITTLTQQETLRLKDTEPVEIQIRARMPNGSAPESDIIVTDVGRVLKDEVI